MQLRAGDRALVTGASFGIGEAIARELASRGVDLVLLARSEDRLRQLAGDLSAVRCTVVACDLRDRIPSAEELGRIDLLVNNAGFGATGSFEEWDREWTLGMVDVNIRALVALTRQLIPPMLERGRGGILNVGSVVGFLPLPYASEYAATKAFVVRFSQGLHAEYARRGVTVTALCPGSTRTRFHQLSSSPPAGLMFSQSATEVARYGVRALEAGKSTAVSGWFNRVGAVLAGMTPGDWTAAVVARGMRFTRRR